MARSRTGGRRPTAVRAPARDVTPNGPEAGPAPAPSLAAATLPRVWRGIGYRPLADAALARPLFDFAAVHCPAPAQIAFGWGAWAASGETVPPPPERLIGALVIEAAGPAAFVHGPVVVTSDPLVDEPLEVASQLVTAALDHAAAAGSVTVFARPHGLDRVWVRFGFIPVPEGFLPEALAGRPGAGLYAWRGGSALWTLREAGSA